MNKDKAGLGFMSCLLGAAIFAGITGRMPAEEKDLVFLGGIFTGLFLAGVIVNLAYLLNNKSEQ